MFLFSFESNSFYNCDVFASLTFENGGEDGEDLCFFELATRNSMAVSV